MNVLAVFADQLAIAAITHALAQVDRARLLGSRPGSVIVVSDDTVFVPEPDFPAKDSREHAIASMRAAGLDRGAGLTMIELLAGAPPGMPDGRWVISAMADGAFRLFAIAFVHGEAILTPAGSPAINAKGGDA